MPKTQELKNQNPVSPMENEQTKVTESNLDRGAVEKGATYNKGERVTGSSGRIAMQPNPVGADRKTLPGLVRE